MERTESGSRGTKRQHWLTPPPPASHSFQLNWTFCRFLHPVPPRSRSFVMCSCPASPLSISLRPTSVSPLPWSLPPTSPRSNLSVLLILKVALSKISITPYEYVLWIYLSLPDVSILFICFLVCRKCPIRMQAPQQQGFVCLTFAPSLASYTAQSLQKMLDKYLLNWWKPSSRVLTYQCHDESLIHLSIPKRLPLLMG